MFKKLKGIAPINKFSKDRMSKWLKKPGTVNTCIQVQGVPQNIIFEQILKGRL